MKNAIKSTFRLSERFLEPYRVKPHKFGYGILGELAYARSYSRLKENGKKEVWNETVERVVNGTFSMLCTYLNENQGKNKVMPFEQTDIGQLAMEMYDKIYNFKFLPPGRGLWAMGTKIITDKKLYAALNNCAFISTELKNSDQNISKPFAFAQDMLMLGTGVGFDTKLTQSGTIIQGPNSNEKPIFYKIEDSREGFVDSTKILLDSYFFGYPKIEFDYSQIRAKGTPIQGFGGQAPGPEPLKILHDEIRKLLDKMRNKEIDSKLVVDIMNLIARCVIDGNVRRSSLAAFGDYNDKMFAELKNYEKYPEREKYGWTSNNSIFANLGMDYSNIVDQIKQNGEPGIAWLENMRNYGRMCEPPNFKDYRIAGGNPCLEQGLESYELCCLVEIFPNLQKNKEEFISTLQSALLYAKIVTLGMPHWEESSEIMKRNRRIGCSLSGIAQFLSENSIETLRDWCDTGYKNLQEYDAYLSKLLNIPRSIKLTSIKPSGTVSLLAGSTPGIHYPDYNFCIRRVRIPENSEISNHLSKKGYKIEKDLVSENTDIVEIPIKYSKKIKTIKDVNMWEQLNLMAFIQKYWADNQISCTIKIKNTDKIKEALEFYQYQLKSVSFLPIQQKSYKQSPIEEITENQYNSLMKNIKNDKEMEEILKNEKEDAKPEIACETDKCVLNINKKMKFSL